MNSLKTVIVMAVMAVVAYGVYATLTKGPIQEATEVADGGSAVDLGEADLGAEESPRYLPPGPEESAPADEHDHADGDEHADEHEHAHDHGREGKPESPLADPFGRDATASEEAASEGVALAHDDDYDSQAGSSAPDETADADAEYDDYGRYDDYTRRPAGDPPADVDRAEIETASGEQPLNDQDSSGRAEFEADMLKVQALLDANHLAEALRGLTAWYGSAQLTTEEQAQLFDLLDQLAGTVVYSTEHWLTEAYVAREGDTLEAVAAEYDVPWQLLAKINGISDPQALTAGEELKVVKGPFEAEVDLSKYRLTLFVDGCYAGRFLIGVGNEPVPAGEFTVEDKQLDPQYTTPDERIVMADDPANPLGKYWIGLGKNLGIHGTLDDRGIGETAGAGWIRLTRRDIEDVFDILTEESPVRIVR